MNKHLTLRVVLCIVLLMVIGFTCSSVKASEYEYGTSFIQHDAYAASMPVTFNKKTDQLDRTVELLRALSDKCYPFVLLPNDDKLLTLKAADLTDWCYKNALNNMDNQDKQLVRTWFGGAYLDIKKLSNTVYSVLDNLGYTKNRKKTHDLLMETAAIESDMGLVVQQKGGPAQGIFQLVPATDRYTMKEIKKLNPEAYKKIMRYYNHSKSASWNRKYNVQYGAAVSLTYYCLVTKFQLDDKIRTRAARASLYKRKYNTNTYSYLIPRYLSRAEKHHLG